jgi:hypothetical protein
VSLSALNIPQEYGIRIGEVEAMGKVVKISEV